MPGSQRTNLYQQVAADLRRRIQDGVLPSGTALPSETALCAEYSVSRQVIRASLAVLQGEGLIRAEERRGWYVREQRPLLLYAARPATDRDTPGTEPWMLDVAEQGRHPTQTLEVTIGRPPVRVAALLELVDGAAAVVLLRARYIDGERHHQADTYFPAELLPPSMIARLDEVGGHFARLLVEAGRAPATCRHQVVARMPTTEEAAALDAAVGVPVMEYLRVDADGQGRPVAVTIALLPGGEPTRLEFYLPAGPVSFA